MTKEKLNRYNDILREIERQYIRLEKLEDTTDVVQGSSSRYPYAEQHIKVSGNPAKKRLEEQIKISLAAAIKAREDIELYIQRIPDPRTREIMRSKYIDCMTWREAADANAVSVRTAKSVASKYLHSAALNKSI